MKMNLNAERRRLLVWSAPVITAVSLPVHAVTSPMLSIVKQQTGGPNPATAEGDVLEYTITVQNTGGVPISGVVVTDTMPDGTVVTLGSPTESITTDNILEVGETWSFATSYTVTLDDLVAGTDLTNVASVSAEGIMGSVSDDAVVSVTQLRACEGPPIVSIPVVPKCAGNPPIGEAAIEIFAPDTIPMELKGIEVTTSDASSTVGDLPTFPTTVTNSTPVTVNWTGPAGDAVTCLPTASISITIEYCCEDQVSLFETYDVTALLIASVT